MKFQHTGLKTQCMSMIITMVKKQPNVSLFQAYRFASLIESPIFDYTASDEETKEFQKELLKFYKDNFSEEEQEIYIIDI